MPVWVLVWVFAGRANMPLGCSRLLAVFFLRFQCVAENIAGGLDAFCVGVGLHFERDAFIGMTEFFGNRSNIRMVRDSDAGERVTQLVRMEMIDAVPFTEFLKIARRGCWVHGLCAFVLRKNVRRDARSALFNSKLPQKVGRVVADVNHTGGSVCFGCVLENALAALLGGRIDQIVFNRDRFAPEID